MNKIKKVMLIYPPVTRPKHFSAKVVRVSAFFPLGVAYMAAALEKTGQYEVVVMDALIDGDIGEGTPVQGGGYIRYGLTDEEIARRILDFAPDAIGVSCLFAAMQVDMGNICRIAKALNPNTVTIVGGTHAGSMPEGILKKHPEVDFIVLGEGEDSLLKILNAAQGKGNCSNINGVAYRENGSIHAVKKSEYIQELDDITFPARHLFDMDKYFEHARMHGFGSLSPCTQMVTSRGCPAKCTFCTLAAPFGVKQRVRSPENVLEEIEHLVRVYGIKELHFEDDNLTADQDRAAAIFDGMVERKFNIKWHVPSGIAAYTLSDGLLAKMKASGCHTITIAIESGNQHVLTDLMRKPMKLHKVPALVKAIRANGIRAQAFWMLGYPDETRENMRETIEFAKSLELDWSYFSVTSPLPSTRMWDVCIKKGYIKEEDFDPLTSFHRGIIRTPEFDPDYVHKIREEAMVDVSFRNNVNLLKYDVDVAIRDFKEVLELYPHFDFANFYLGEAYRRKGEITTAIDCYKKTLELNPSYREAEERLRELGGYEILERRSSSCASIGSSAN